MTCLLQGIGGILQGFQLIYPAGLGGAHRDSGAVCPYWWLYAPIHPKYVLWGCSLAILQAAPSWWHCPVEGTQRQPEHGEVWRYHLGSSSYPWNAAWQMTQRCFAICLLKAHQGGICRGAQEVIWHHCERLPRCMPNHYKLGPYKPGTFASSAHQANEVTLVCHLTSRVGIWTRHQR